MEWVKPWMVALALALAGVGGAVGVTFAARAQHSHDRDDVIAFAPVEQRAARDHAFVGVVQSIEARLDSGAALGPKDVQDLRAARLAFVAELEALKGPSAPVVGAVVALYLQSFQGAKNALTTVEQGVAEQRPLTATELKAYAVYLKDGVGAYDRAGPLLQQIRCHIVDKTC